MPSSDPVATFIARWGHASAAERANYAMFLSELTDVLGVPRPDPATDDTAHNAYVFERAVTFHHRGSEKTTTGRIDLYKRGCFVLEAKQYATAKPVAGSTSDPTLALENLDLDEPPTKSAKIARGTAAWDRAMLEALGQADHYARNLPTDEDPPPFLIVVDVGHVIELYADFTQKGKNYLPFPDARSHRIKLADLASADLRDRLRAVWTAPLTLDPAKKSAAVTREVAGYLAELAKSFERDHDPRLVAEFLSRCLFCMFAEDVGLLPKNAFKDFLDSLKDDPGAFVPLIEQLFADMNEGRVSGLLRKKLLYFNGGLFASAKALPVNGTQLGLLRRAASLEWRHVEPAIFGTLLERALSPDERHKLGAHYTPRAYVERLVLPTLIEPLREEWSSIRIGAVTLAQRDTTADLKQARATVRAFHERLCAVRVLDPACGSGNFLYVALEQMKRLEGEVIALLHDLGDTGTLNLQGSTVDPHQFLGIEINPRAAAIAELVLWIGYLQWHFRVHGEAMPAEPVLRRFNNIECRDAVLAYDKHAFATDPATGKTRFVWDRKSYKTDPVTGREIPDEARVRPLDVYENPRPATWPQADYIIGNPPFLGTSRMREDLGDGYTETLRAAYKAMPESADFVMFWWHKAALETLAGRTRRFGFITTNSIRQTFNRRVVQAAMDQGIYLTFAIPDHPWIDAAECAAVRIAMTVGARASHVGALLDDARSGATAAKLYRVTQELANKETGEHEIQLNAGSGRISADLTTGANVAEMEALHSNSGLSSMGVKLHGEGFLVTPAEAKALGLGRENGLEKYIRPFRSGRDMASLPRGLLAIDLLGLDEEQVRSRFPLVYERLVSHVRPERASNARSSYRDFWWLFGEPRKAIRPALESLKRYVSTTRTASHRLFSFLDTHTIPESEVVIIASDDAFHLGVLSGRIHVVYSLAAGGWMGVGNDPRYNNSRCFDPFPFPDCAEKQKERIRGLAEELDAHRKRAQATHRLGLTDIYNVLEKLRAGETLTAKDKTIHDAALVSTLKQLHDDLDAAVAAAYGWPWPLTDAEILERVVALNAQRAKEEAEGKIRWLRPEYQIPLLAPETQTALGLSDGVGVGAGLPRDSSGKPKPKASRLKPKARKKVAWPKTIPERAKAVEAALAAAEAPLSVADLTAGFTRAKPADVAEILATLVALSRAHESDTKGKYVR